MDKTHAIALIAVAALVTVLLRFLPFVIFGDRRKTPEIINYLGHVLPYAIISMLVVYCLKGVSFASAPYGLPEIIASLIVVLLHAWKRNTLLSIVTGTVSYMLLIQFVFA